MRLSESTLRELEFVKIDKDNPIKATFKLTEIFSIQGITLNAISESDLPDLSFRSADFSFGFGNSVNDICESLIQEEYITNEAEWMKEKKAGIILRLKSSEDAM